MKVAEGVELHDDPGAGLRCWLDTQHARGWLTPAAGASGIGSKTPFSRHYAAAAAQGFVAADAAVLAMMQACHPDKLPSLSWGDQPAAAVPLSRPGRRLDLYAIVDSADRISQVLSSGVKTVQLRIKTPEQPDTQWAGMLRSELQRSVATCAAAGAELFVK